VEPAIALIPRNSVERDALLQRFLRKIEHNPNLTVLSLVFKPIGKYRFMVGSNTKRAFPLA
jgi:hypothetical protein